MQVNQILCADCISAMATLPNDCVDFTLTDIPYNAVNRYDSGFNGKFRKLNKGKADILTFDLQTFLSAVYRVTKNNIAIFCGKEQFSEIFAFFANKKGTTRPIIWQKTNPPPLNAQYTYLSGIEMAVWHKKSKSKVFNAFYKNSVFCYPCGSSKIHPTEKNHALLADLIKDNTNEGDIVFDPCAGSGAHCLVAKNLNRRFLGFELDKDFANKAQKRLLDLLSAI